MIKIDMEKAYDRMSWSFIEDTLRDVSIPNNLIEVIMLIISTGRYRMLWNDEAIDYITPSRGLWQGDLLYPLLFVLCMKRLCHWIQLKVEQGSWRASKGFKNWPQSLTSLFCR